MTPADLPLWAEFGFPALMVGVLILVIYHLSKMHREERGEWREEARQEREDHARRADQREERSLKSYESLSASIDRLAQKIE